MPQERLGELADLFTEAFLNDPLYVKIIPDVGIRSKVLPKYFNYYLDMYYGHCQIYANSPGLEGAVVVLDEEELEKEYSPAHILPEGVFNLRLLFSLLVIDPTGRTAFSFVKNRKYLTSKWAAFVGPGHMHIDFLAVSSRSRGKGIASQLVKPLLEAADRGACHFTLETHNPGNLALYEHFGFRVVERIGGEQNFYQYCLER